DAGGQGDVAAVDVTPHGHQRRADHDRGEAAEGDVDAPPFARVPVHVHDSVVRPWRETGNGIDTPLTRPSSFLTRPWRVIAVSGPVDGRGLVLQYVPLAPHRAHLQ